MNAAHRVGRMCVLLSLSFVGTAAAQPTPKGASPAKESPSSPATADAAAQARTLYEKGRSQAVAGHWQEAYATQRAAYAWFPHWQIAGGLGDAAFVLGKYPEAVEMLSQYVREATNLAAQERTDAEKRRDEAKGKCGVLAIEAPSGAELRLDGALVGKLPLQKVLYVSPGAHTVEIVTAAGVTGTKQTVTVAAGDTVRVAIQSSAAQPMATTGPTAAPTPNAGAEVPRPGATPSGTLAGGPGAQASAAAPKPNLVPVVVLGAGAGLGLVAGGVLMGISVARENEATERLSAVNNAPRPCKAAPCMKIDGLFAERDAFGSAALGVWVGSASLAALAAIVYVAQSRRGTAAAVRWAPVVSTNGAGLVVRGAF